jgi:hypothetical protein
MSYKCSKVVKIELYCAIRLFPKSEYEVRRASRSIRPST